MPPPKRADQRAWNRLPKALPSWVSETLDVRALRANREASQPSSGRKGKILGRAFSPWSLTCRFPGASPQARIVCAFSARGTRGAGLPGRPTPAGQRRPPGTPFAPGWYSLRLQRRGHSWRNASTGSIREARTAGSSPETMPTTARMPKETSMMVGEARRRMSPSWFAVLKMSE